MRDLDDLFAAFSKSAFRRSFYLQGKELTYLQSKGLPLVLAHAQDFIAQRLAPAVVGDVWNNGIAFRVGTS